MKKIVSLILFLILFNLTNVFADELELSYYPDNSIDSIIATDYSTVIVYKSPDITNDSIVYVNQIRGSVFDAATRFYLKEEPAIGTYTVVFGGKNRDPISKDFLIGLDADPQRNIIMSKIEGDSGVMVDDENGLYNVGYTAEVSAGTYKSVLITKDGKTLGYNIDEINIIGNAIIGIQINGIKQSEMDSIKVYISQNSVSDDDVLDIIQ